jgi:cell division protein FtsB
MLTTNLSTRPFYNERAVRSILGLLLLLVIALTVFSLFRASSLRTEERALSAQATQAHDEAERLRAQTQAMTAQINPKELEAVSAEASEANAVIAQREFSWIALLGQIEEALPDDVRVTAVQPQIEKGTTMVRLEVEAMSAEHLATFMDALEKNGAFQRVLPRTKAYGDNDEIDAVLEAVYRPGGAPTARTGAAKAASPKGGRSE